MNLTRIKYTFDLKDGTIAYLIINRENYPNRPIGRYWETMPPNSRVFDTPTDEETNTLESLLSQSGIRIFE